MANMQISTAGLAYIKDREKLRLKAYQPLPGSNWTIGYGVETYESGARVKSADVITAARAVQLLSYHVGVAAAAVNRMVTSDLKQGQFDALVSFCYNAGSGAFQDSQLRSVVNDDPNDIDAVQIQWSRWVYSTVNGVKVQVPGLVTRRREEMEMYRNGTVSSNYSWLWIVLILILLYRFRRGK